jgi:hypothetical protein
LSEFSVLVPEIVTAASTALIGMEIVAGAAVATDLDVQLMPLRDLQMLSIRDWQGIFPPFLFFDGN